MTDNNHPITPPPELVKQWFLSARAMPVDQWVTDVATQAARWGADQQLQLDAEQVNQAWQRGADQELEACCEWLSVPCPSYGRELRNARRPKPPSLKEQALGLLNEGPVSDLLDHQVATIRRALESLPD